MSNTKLSFRVDASSSIGLGHITRCIELAKLLKNKFEIYFYSKEISENLISIITEEGFNFISIKNESMFFNAIKNENVVLDGYQFNSEYQKALSSLSKNLISVDERQNIFYHSDILINNNPKLPNDGFDIKDGGIVHTGIEYSILKEVFRIENKKQFKPLMELPLCLSIFICFGGSDPKNLSKKTLEIILEHSNASVDLVLGPSYDIKLIEEYTISDRVRIYSSISSIVIAELIKKSDLVVVPCSTIMLEAFCIGKPIISGWFEQNQNNSLDYFNDNNYLKSCGNFNDEEFKDNLILAIQELDVNRANTQIANQKAIKFSDSKLIEVFNNLDE